jgi:hypothetical protein
MDAQVNRAEKGTQMVFVDAVIPIGCVYHQDSKISAHLLLHIITALFILNSHMLPSVGIMNY